MRKGELFTGLPIAEVRTTVADGLNGNWNTDRIADDCSVEYQSLLERLRRAGTDVDDVLRERLIARRKVEWERRRPHGFNGQPRGHAGRFTSRAA